MPARLMSPGPGMRDPGRAAAALPQATASASAAAALPGSRMPGPGDISRAGIAVTDLTDPTSGDLTARRL